MPLDALFQTSPLNRNQGTRSLLQHCLNHNPLGETFENHPGVKEPFHELVMEGDLATRGTSSRLSMTSLGPSKSGVNIQ